MPRHIIISGFAAAGKTTIGRALAQRINRPLLDLDDHISQRTGQTISQLLRPPLWLTQPRFRRTEHRLLAEALAQTTPAVIALGGGTPAHRANQRLLRDSGCLIIYLKVEMATIAERLNTDLAGRPLFASCRDLQEVRQRAERLMRRRERYYLRPGVVPIEATNRTVAQVVEDIVIQLDLR